MEVVTKGSFRWKVQHWGVPGVGFHAADQHLGSAETIVNFMSAPWHGSSTLYLCRSMYTYTITLLGILQDSRSVKPCARHSLPLQRKTVSHVLQISWQDQVAKASGWQSSCLRGCSGNLLSGSIMGGAMGLGVV